MKRVLLIAVASILALGLAGSLALWFVLSSWVPTKGKALLIQEVERRWPVEVAIDAVRYEFLRGLVLESVRVTERSGEAVWLSAPIARVGVGWVSVALRRVVPFRVQATLEHPCQTHLTLSGRFRMQSGALDLDMESAELPIASIIPPLRQYIPPALTEGRLRLRAHLTHAPPAPLRLSGELEGEEIVWGAGPWRVRGDLSADGRLTLPAGPGGTVSYDARARLRRATLEGPPPVGSVTDVEGVAAITPERIEIGQLTGRAMGSAWMVQGTVSLSPRVTVESLVESTLELKSFAEQFPAIGQQWQPDGRAQLRASCRAALQPVPAVDCVSQVEARDVTLAGSLLAHPLTQLTGSLDYDLVTRRLTIRTLEGRLLEVPFTVSGQVGLMPHLPCTLSVRGVLPLGMLRAWLPPSHPVERLEGAAAVDVRIADSLTAPRLEGSIDVQEAEVALTAPALTLQHLSGTVRFSPDAVDIEHVTVRLNDQPLLLNARLTPQPEGGWLTPRNTPRLTAIIRLPEGELVFDGTIRPETFDVTAARLTLGASDLTARGLISRSAERPTHLQFAGTVELSELTRLPFLPPQNALASWKLQGLAEVDGTFLGVWGLWDDAELRGRLAAQQLSVRDMPIEQLTATVEQSNRALRLRIPSAYVADGKFLGELTVQHRGASQEFFAQADLINLQLARLAQTIPAWRSRSVTGMASSQATCSGTWEDRATWLGEGWLNGSGERLGDLPLLDKLFRGLFGLLEDRLGLESLRRAEITEASVRWRLAQERFRTEDLRLGGTAGDQPVAVYAKGSVGFDQTLDFIIEPELSEGIVLEAPSTSTLAHTILKAAGQLERFRRLVGRHRLTGTLKEPQYRFELTLQDAIKQLAPGPIDLLQNLFGR